MSIGTFSDDTKMYTPASEATVETHIKSFACPGAKVNPAKVAYEVMDRSGDSPEPSMKFVADAMIDGVWYCRGSADTALAAAVEAQKQLAHLLKFGYYEEGK